MAKKICRKIGANEKILINKLAEILYDFLPLSSPAKNTTTFKTIFKESKVDKYLSYNGTKQQVLENGFLKVYKYNSKLPFTLIRKIIPASISYRVHKRNPLTQIELDELSQILYQLKIDMRKELSEIVIDESLPRIQVPPEKLIIALRGHDLVAEISTEPLQLFSDGHFNESVRKAMEKFESKLQQIKNTSNHGKSFMGEVFKSDKYIITTNISESNLDTFREGFMLLTMGAMQSIRNIFSHGDEEARTPEECFEMLLFINWLFRNIKTEDIGG